VENEEHAQAGTFLAVNVLALTAEAATPKMPTFFARRDYPLIDYFVQVADMNGDRIPDVIAGGFGVIEVEFGNGDGTFRPGPTTTQLAGSAFSFAAADLNGDGKIDLAFANQSSIVVALGNGDGTFQSGVTYSISDNDIGFLVIGDFNGDGKLDIATAGQLGVWLLAGTGNGSFNSATLALSLQDGDDIAAADFNGDGKLDLAVTLTFAGSSGGGFAVLLGNGNGTFQTPQTFSAPAPSGDCRRESDEGRTTEYRGQCDLLE
jgi:FG-GAP-like repeat